MLLYLFIPCKTATLVPKFAVEYLPLGRTAALEPELAVKDLSLGRGVEIVKPAFINHLQIIYFVYWEIKANICSKLNEFSRR